MVQYEAALRATQGARAYQEDTAEIWPRPAGVEGSPGFRADQRPTLPPGNLVTVLADGMGGHAGGSLASRMACEAFLDAYARSADIAPQVPARLSLGLDHANAAIAAKVVEKPALAGMGTTLVGTAFGPQGLEWISVGDSPLYLFRRGELALLNEDHSLAPALDQLAAQGKITVEQARNDVRRHMLRSAVSGDDLDLIDLSHMPLPLESGDYVIAASDGIHTLDQAEITRIVQAWSLEGPAAIAAALIRRIDDLQEQHQDNTTVVVVRPVALPPTA
jgi:PPM family protein phosphatase